MLAQGRQDDVRFVRVSWCDQHGLIRSRTVTHDRYQRTLDMGVDFPSLTIFDTTNHPIFYPFAPENELGLEGISGLPDCLLKADPQTYRRLPWVADTAWVLGDMHLENGAPDQLCTRQILKRQTARLADAGFELIVGLELEFYIFKVTDRNLSAEQCGKPPTPPSVANIGHGHQYLSDLRADEIDDILSELRSCLLELDLPLAGLDPEWGPGQCEVIFEPQSALAAADTAVLARSAIKQMASRRGSHATFMTFPKLANVIPSGWHLHQSLKALDGGRNAFSAPSEAERLTPVARNWIAGLLAHATGCSVLTTPTVNGYKRYRPDSLAPLNASWGFENRSVMLRVIGAGRDDAHIENRTGEPCANPYLYIASQIIAGLHGIEANLEPCSPVAAGYAFDGQRLPPSLVTAIEAFKQDNVVQANIGANFARYFARLKQSECNRFDSAVTDWEHNEYFEMF
jgi:glutamine synthetase